MMEQLNKKSQKKVETLIHKQSAIKDRIKKLEVTFEDTEKQIQEIIHPNRFRGHILYCPFCKSDNIHNETKTGNICVAEVGEFFRCYSCKGGFGFLFEPELSQSDTQLKDE